MSGSVKRVFVAGDWDADGVIAAALIVYSQEKAGQYPLESKAVVDKTPLDPDRAKYFLANFKGGYDVAVFLDIPYSEHLGNAIKMMRNHFGVSKIIFVDHHVTSLQKAKELQSIVDVALIDHRMPTAGLVLEELNRRGISVHQRLRSFVEVVKYMDTGRRVPDQYMKLFELTKMFSKALTVVRDEALWSKIVDWLATPTPMPMPLDEALWSKVKAVIEERDKEVAEKAVELAVGAIKIGDFRFIDARNKWKKRGVTALASKLSTILKAPVILLAGTNREYFLLVIKASHGRAYRIAKYLVGEGIALDIAGHPNLAIVRLPKDLEKQDLVDKLHHAIYYSS
ncbi:DHH family phosphoesterase [Desulfurococcus mucosus]|uniref:Phosphoesterase, RecJ domain protein n=1 Tax=Desulfurococcus mucosus (strain ATCC 35584 / DSM 2162 / JCM 9187 / O7/1) TaxID=765177 RepID=E8R704_DESM0|nr:phosphoesterase [Desulfurococcus mucosus]ADV64437.1 phosphoesterase, RecJ domain protein [Desulfurococcus mucosus DSM 2162]